MRNVIVFHDASDSDAAGGVCAALAQSGANVSSIAGRVPASVTFGSDVGVVVVWSQAASSAEAASPALASEAEHFDRTLLVRVDEAQVAAHLSAARTVQMSADAASNAALLGDWVRSGGGERAVLGAPRRSLPQRPSAVAARRLKRRPQGAAAGTVAAASAMGALAAVAAGWAMPAGVLSTAAQASPLVDRLQAGDLQVHENEARAHALVEAGAHFVRGVQVTSRLNAFTVEERAAIDSQIETLEAEFAAIRSRSDAAMDRLNALAGSLSIDTPMPMAAAPEASLSVVAAANEAEGEPRQLALRGTFPVEPDGYAVEVLDAVYARPRSAFASASGI